MYPPSTVLRTGTEVTTELLLESGVVSREKDGIKILGNGDITKKLTVKSGCFLRFCQGEDRSSGRKG